MKGASIYPWKFALNGLFLLLSGIVIGIGIVTNPFVIILGGVATFISLLLFLRRVFGINTFVNDHMIDDDIALQSRHH